MPIWRALLACGFIAPLLYAAGDTLGGLVWPGYRYQSQGVSELMSHGAPSRPLVLSMMTLHNLVLIAFAIGVWKSADQVRTLRFTALFLIANAVIGLITPTFFPAPQRGSSGDATMHIVLTGANVFSILLAIGFATTGVGRRFGLFSIATIVVLLGLGSLGTLDAARIEAHLATPWLGVTERVLIYGYLFWLTALAAILLRQRRMKDVPTGSVAA